MRIFRRRKPCFVCGKRRGRHNSCWLYLIECEMEWYR